MFVYLSIYKIKLFNIHMYLFIVYVVQSSGGRLAASSLFRDFFFWSMSGRRRIKTSSHTRTCIYPFTHTYICMYVTSIWHKSSLYIVWDVHLWTACRRCLDVAVIDKRLQSIACAKSKTINAKTAITLTHTHTYT